jgi:hypothetical protein
MVFDQRRITMKRVAGLLALVLVASLLGTSDVHGGFGGGPAGKTIGPSVTATIVIDVTGTTPGTPGKGDTAIRLQRAGASTAVLFNSTVIHSSAVSCQQVLQERANHFDRFVGLMNTWVNSPWLEALLQPFGTPVKAAITDTDYAVCTSVAGRDILSLTAVIQFQP